MINPKSLSCGSLTYKTLYCDNCGDELVVPITCSRRSCPDCSAINASRIVSRYQSFIDKLQVVPVSEFVFITLTTLSVSVGFLSRHYRQTRKQLFRLFHRKEWVDNIQGGFYVFEVSCRPDDTFHLHIHIVARVRSGLSVVPYTHLKNSELKTSANIGKLSGFRLAEIWCCLSGAYVVDITPAYNSTRRLFSYSLKYLSKAPKFYTMVQVQDYDNAFFNTRRLSFFGSFYGLLPDTPVLVCKACKVGHYTITDDWLNYCITTPKEKLRDKGMLLDNYG